MKTLTLLTAAILLATGLFAQKQDTTKIIMGKSKILIINDANNPQDHPVLISDTSKTTDHHDAEDDSSHAKKNGFNGHWAGIDLGINNYMTGQNSTTLPLDDKYLEVNQGKSWYIGLNFLEQNISLVKNRVGLVTGLGLGINNYRFRNNVVLMSDSSSLYAVKDTINIFKKNKLTATYLTVPLMLEFQIPVNKEKSRNIIVAAGVTGGVKIGSHTKQLYIANGITCNNKTHDDFHIATWHYGLTARIGIGGLNLFANYDLAGLFSPGEGPEVYPLSVGISFSDF